MILIILAVCILLVFLGIVIDIYADCEVTGDILTAAGGLGTLASVVVAIYLIISISGLMVIDDKIAMYEKENKSIEKSVSIIVKNYQDYESEMFKNAKLESTENFIAVATQIYPELKSNDLVKEQINIYVSNNKKIKELKEEKIDYKAFKWWLYFGG